MPPTPESWYNNLPSGGFRPPHPRFTRRRKALPLGPDVSEPEHQQDKKTKATSFPLEPRGTIT